ncbi:MAG: YbhB/YbcL family Raf kinase inhibitor-like protein [Deltaproteobacteria bacterium]|nr:YbhB/YbcL family Raf kinase inhibitor-like protein [Deltaproteobacteria bacterium]
MKHILTITTLVVASVLVTTVVSAADFTLRSKALKPGAAIGTEHYSNNAGCSGGNVMPDLEWSNAPKDTKSFAVTLFDKDAPTGSGFWHWVAYDIPADTTGLPGGATGGMLPAGTVEGNTDLGKPGFFGPCPPAGRQHTYLYTVHALKVAKLPVDKGVSPATVGFFLWQNGLAKATFTVQGKRTITLAKRRG